MGLEDCHRILKWIFGSPNNPTIQLGSITTPAQILPFLVSSVFIYHKTSRVRVHRTRDVEKGKIAPPQTKETLSLSDLKDPDVLRKYLWKAILAYHVFITWAAMAGVGMCSLLPHEALCITQAIVLVLYGLFIKPSVKKSHLTTATGWLLMSFLDKLSPWTQIPALCLTILLACPVAWQADSVHGEQNLQQASSAILLMMLSINRFLFESPEAGLQWFAQYNHQLKTAYMAAIFLPNAIVAERLKRRPKPVEAETQKSSSWTMQNIFQSLVSNIGLILFIIGSLATTEALAAITTGFLSTCLPWSRFIFLNSSLNQAPEIFTIAFIAGAVVQWMTWSVISMLRDQEDAKRADEGLGEWFVGVLFLSVESVGWACTIMNGIWMVLGVWTWLS